MENLADKSVGQLVAEDLRSAQVFENHKIDFCCNGNKSIKEVAQEKDLNLEDLLQEIENAKKVKAEGANDFNSWPLDLLSDYIKKTYHRKAEEQISMIKPYLEKICQVHGDRHPELFEIKELFHKGSGGIAAHQKKEELMLFPFIKKMAQAKENNEEFKNPTSRSVENPVDMLTHEHDAQGDIFKKISELSNNYTVPEDGCNTYRRTLDLLKQFEEDLHKHIHLENNILFPKALKLEKELTA